MRPHYAGLDPEEILIITSVETLKVVADPLRLQILALLRDEPRAAKQIARELGAPLKKLYYHLGLLEEHGLIRVADTRVVSGIIEKRYRVTAYRLSVERDLLSPQAAEGQAGLDAFLSLVLDHAQAEIRRSVRAGLINLRDAEADDHGLALGRHWATLTPQQADEYLRRLKQLDRAFFADLPPPGDGAPRRYEFLTGLYPVLPPEETP